MDPSNAQQAMGTHSLEDVLGCNKPQQEKRMRPHPEQALKCPRCDSTNTKFCYYNNYSLSQPRYFCKGCRRYWTQGGSLRNVPVGGGCRKNKRSSSSSKRSQDQSLTTNSNPLPPLPSLPYDSNDLTLAFARLQQQTTRQVGLDDHSTSFLGNPNSIHTDVLNSMKTNFLDAPSVFHNFYYGLGELEGVGGGEEVILPLEEMGTMATTTTTRPGSCKGSDGENKPLWGMQWQQHGGDGNMVNDSGRDYWNGIGSSWPGLVNGPLF